MTDDDTPEVRGRRLRELRETHGLSLSQLGTILCLQGKTLGSRATTVHRWEQGTCPPWALRMAELALADLDTWIRSQKGEP